MKTISRILSAISATVLCTASFAGTVSNAATGEKYNTYAVYCDVNAGSGVMWADVYFRYNTIDIDEMEVETVNFGGNVTHTTVERTDGKTVYSASFKANGSIMAPGVLFRTIFLTTDNMSLVEDTLKTSAFDSTRKFIGNDKVEASFVLLGDANQDEKVTPADATAVLQYLGNPTDYPLSKKGGYAADVNFDGVVNNDDLELIDNYLYKDLNGFY